MKKGIFTRLFLATIAVGSFVQVMVGEHYDDASNYDNGEDITAMTSATTPAIDISNYVSMAIPDGDTSFKSYMDYRCITNTSSAQYKLQERAYTNDEGIREVDGYLCVALGSYYANYVGETVKITLDSGVSFDAIVGDFKADCHTDSTNRYSPMSGERKNIVEFIVDTPCLSKKVRNMGDVSYAGYSGNVVSIEKED